MCGDTYIPEGFTPSHFNNFSPVIVTVL